MHKYTLVRISQAGAHIPAWPEATPLVFKKYRYAVVKHLVWSEKPKRHIPDL